MTGESHIGIPASTVLPFSRLTAFSGIAKTLQHEGVLQIDHREHAARDFTRGVADRAPHP
jgi:hypothetical protein